MQSFGIQQACTTFRMKLRPIYRQKRLYFGVEQQVEPSMASWNPSTNDQQQHLDDAIKEMRTASQLRESTLAVQPAWA